MSETLETVIQRIVAHAKAQMACIEQSVANQEYETAEFCAGVLSHDIIQLRQLLNYKLRYLKQEAKG